MRVKETRNHLIGFFGLREIGFVPEAVVEGLEDGELRVDSCAQEGAVQDSRAAQHHVARTGQKERWRHAVQIGVERRKHGIFRIGGTDIVCQPLHSFGGRSQMSGEASD